MAASPVAVEEGNNLVQYQGKRMFMIKQRENKSNCSRRRKKYSTRLGKEEVVDITVGETSFRVKVDSIFMQVDLATEAKGSRGYIQ